MHRRRCIDFCVYLVVRVLIGTVQALPIDTCHRLAGGLATLFCGLLGIRRRIVDDNLRQAYPQLNAAERRALAWEMWEHLFLMVAEVAHARRKIHITNWHRHVRFLREAEFARHLLARRPSVIVSGHFGNFELSGYFLGLFGFPTYSIARPLDNVYLNRFLDRFRGATGQYMLPKNGSAQQVAVLLQQGATLALLGDQHAGPSGCWVDFYGRPASTHKAIALFALASDAPLLVSYCRRSGGPLLFESGLEAVADPRSPQVQQMSVSQLTQWYTDKLAAIIDRAPDQYWWLHRRWKGEPKRRTPRQERKSPPAA
ncbi:MAG: lysophospholipid acyltransferase family protein [Pirellulales bacterium]